MTGCGREAPGPPPGAPVGLTLTVSAPAQARAGQPLAVRAVLRNDSDRDWSLFHDPVVLVVLDQAGEQLTGPGWRQPATVERVIPAGTAVALAGDVPLHAPRAGGRSETLPAGRYLLRAHLTIGWSPSGAEVTTATLASPPVPLELLAP